MQHDKTAENGMKTILRRRFINKLWLLLGTLACFEFSWLGISTFKSHHKRQQEADTELFVTAGDMKNFSPNTVTAIPHGQFYIASLEDGGFLAISKKCTHLGCAVPWDESQQKFICPCHGSVFNLVGEVLSAPAPRPLDVFPLRIENGVIKVNISKPQKRDSFLDSQVTRLS